MNNSLNSDGLQTDVANYLWCDWDAAAIAAREHPAMDVLRRSHGMLSKEMFIDALESGQLQVILMPHDAIALVAWGLCEEGKTLHILTLYTSMEFADEVIDYMEAAARDAGAKCIMAVTRHGWESTAKRHDYDTHRCLYIKKVLYDSVS